MSKVVVTEDAIRLEGIESRDPDVVSYLRESTPDSREDLVLRALSLGTYGLRAIGVAGQAEMVEREFLKVAAGFQSALGNLESRLLDRVDVTFDPDRAESVSARLGSTIASAYADATKSFEAIKHELGELVTDSFNPDLGTSCVSRIVKLVSDAKAELDKAFDPSYGGSHLSHLASLIDDYFGESGALADVVAAQISPLKADLLASLMDVRDLVVGQAAAAEARRLSPVSGTDFEDEVELLLRGIARGYGDSVERVGSVAGDGGASKKGDFVVQVRGGLRFVVEAKDHSRPITLRGARGILAQLNDSMENRGASFAIAVAKDPTTFPKEVGHFNDYDGDKLLCCAGQTGELLETAYRWARAVLLAASSGGELDAEALETGLEEVRDALRELGRIDAKAKAITKGADEIRTILNTQLRKAAAGLDEAASGLSAVEKAGLMTRLVVPDPNWQAPRRMYSLQTDFQGERE